jgi:hypothetical protein
MCLVIYVRGFVCCNVHLMCGELCVAPTKCLCDDCRLVNVLCTALSHTLMVCFLVAGQRGSCDISLSTGNINISEYQPLLVCPSQVDLHWFISGSLRINRISLGFHQTTALYLLITFLLFIFLTHAFNRNNSMMAVFLLLFEKPQFTF